MGRHDGMLPLTGRCLLLVLGVALCTAQEAVWLQLEARPELESHMDGVALAGPYFDCQCGLDMKCLCDKSDDFTESFLEERTDDAKDDAKDGAKDGAKDDAKDDEKAKEPAPKPVDLNAKSKVNEAEDEPSAPSNSTASDEPSKPKRDPNLDAPRPYFIDPRKNTASTGCGKPSCMKVDVFCANKKKSACQQKGECCLKARREQKFLRAQENSAFKQQKEKDFDEFQQVVHGDEKLWKRVEKLDLWREKGQVREQVDEAIKLKTSEYQQKLDQLDAAIAARTTEKATLKSWKQDKVAYFASRMGQMKEYEKYLDMMKEEVEANRAGAVKQFKANEQRMDDYLAGSESVLSARENKLSEEAAKLQNAIKIAKAAHEEQDQEDKNEQKDLAAREKDGKGPFPVTTEARDGKMPAGGDPPEAKAAF